MTENPRHLRSNRRASTRLLIVALLGLGLALLFALGSRYFRARQSTPPPVVTGNNPRLIVGGRNLSIWWDGLPSSLLDRSAQTGEQSNIHPSDYAGPETCKECHKRNYESWSSHSHHWMNAQANSSTVKGDFSGKAGICYRGVRAKFERNGDKFLMRLVRGDEKRTYVINQTVGSRFFQYYVGKQIEGPEPKTHSFYSKDHVLQFGYWLSQKEWVPTVHIGTEVPDEKRPDPISPPASGPYYAEYAAGCNYCHTTFPLADMFARSSRQMGQNAPFALHWSLRGYLEAAHPEMVNLVSSLLDRRDAMRGIPDRAAVTEDAKDRNIVRNPMTDWEATKYAVTQGISCEACHLGGREHVQSGGKVPPKFFPSSPYLYAEGRERSLDFGRTHDNVNWACGRCHTGRRPQYAAGMSTWNSVEYDDAMRGSCYSELRCIDCHNPHRTIRQKWSLTADQDDAMCLKCHAKYQPEQLRVEHTHHPTGSPGARCMNCHMPRINEGLEGMVRTHMIYSPNRPDMIEANHPNACNLCHVRQTIDWTVGYLTKWYGAKFDKERISEYYSGVAQGVAYEWLTSENPAVRLVGVDSLVRARERQALPQLFDELDDPFLVNRQFAAKGLQELLDTRLSDFGYRFYMTKEERRRPLAELRAKFVSGADSTHR